MECKSFSIYSIPSTLYFSHFIFLLLKKLNHSGFDWPTPEDHDDSVNMFLPLEDISRGLITTRVNFLPFFFFWQGRVGGAVYFLLHQIRRYVMSGSLKGNNFALQKSFSLLGKDICYGLF